MFVSKWSSGGEKRHATTSFDGGVYVCDQEQGVIDKFSSSGTKLLRIQDASLCYPVALVVERSLINGEDVFVLDGRDNHILKFEIRGKSVRLVKEEAISGPFGTPVDIALLGGRFFVTDIEYHTVHVLATTGEYVGNYGSEGCDEDNLCCPFGVAVDPRRREVFVCDTGNCRVQVLNECGEFVRSWGCKGAGIGQFNEPKGISLNPETNTVVVADSLNNRVQGFDLTLLGKVCYVIPGLNNPVHVTFDSDDDILVVDEDGAQWYAAPDTKDGSDSDDDDQSIDEVSKAQINSGPDSPSDSDSSGDYYEDDYEEEEEEEPPTIVQVDPSTPLKYEEKNKEEFKLEESKLEESHQRDHNTEPAKRGSTSPRPRNVSTSRIHRRFVADALDMKHDVIAMKDIISTLESERNQLRYKKEQQSNLLYEQSESLTAKPSSMVSLTSLHDSKCNSRGKNILDSQEKIMQCSDPLLLEERILELEILNKDLAKSVPRVENEATLARERADKQLVKLETARKQLDRIPKQLSQTSHEAGDILLNYERELRDLQKELEKQKDAHSKRTKNNKKTLDGISEEIKHESGTLCELRCNVESLRKRILAIETRKKPLQEEKQRLQDEYENLGGEKAVLHLVFKKHTRQGKRLGKARFTLALKQAAEAQNIKNISIYDKDLIQIFGKLPEDGFDFEAFSQAYNTLIRL